MKTVSVVRICAMLVMIASCNRETDRRNGFAVTVEVVSRQKDFDSVFLQYPYRVKVTSSAMYVTDLHPDEYFCHEFEYPSLRYVNSFARRGKGPMEVTDVINIIACDDGLVYMLNDNTREIYTYDSGRRQMEVLAEMPEELIRCLDFTLYNDSVFIVPDYSGKQRLLFIGRDGGIIRRMGTIPGKDKAGAVPEIALSRAWRPFIHYNPNNGILALAAQFGEVLEIYDLRHNQTKVVVGPGGEPEWKYRGNDAIPDGIRGYSDVFVGERNIYAVFWGCEIEKINSGEIKEQGGNIIHVFDLEGNPVRRYILDRHITGFHVDEATGTVLGTDVNNEQLVSFKL